VLLVRSKYLKLRFEVGSIPISHPNNLLRFCSLRFPIPDCYPSEFVDFLMGGPHVGLESRHFAARPPLRQPDTAKFSSKALVKNLYKLNFGPGRIFPQPSSVAFRKVTFGLFPTRLIVV
jgi:hypothetical protein